MRDRNIEMEENKITIIFNYMIVTLENPREVIENLLEPVKEYNLGPVQNKLFFKNLSKLASRLSNKLWYLHTIKHYCVVFKNKENLTPWKTAHYIYM